MLFWGEPATFQRIAGVAIIALVYFAFGKFLGVKLPIGTVIKMLR